MPGRTGRSAAAALIAIGLAACSSSHHGRNVPAPRPAPAEAGLPTTELSFAFNTSPPTNWNPLAAGAAGEGLTAVADQVLPSVFTFGPSFNPILNSVLMESVTETSGSPQTLVYRINPKAVWADGVPITGADFVYNWQAQAGRGTDVGGQPFNPASESGYSLVQSVTVSPTSPDQVTVVFSSPYPDWPALFRHMVPAHVAEKIGFNSGFTDPVSDLISGGPYSVVGFDRSGFLRLARNPSYWGPPASTLELDFRFVPGMQQLVSALALGQIGCADVPATEAALSPLRSAKNLNLMVAPGPLYIDLEFQQGAGPLHAQTLRSAVTLAISRQAVITAAIGTIAPTDPPVANRFLVPGETDYTPHGPPAAAPLPHPSGALSLSVDRADPVALAAAQSIVQQLDAAGFSVSVTGLSGHWDLALRVRALSPFPGDQTQTYLTGSSSNASGVSDAAFDSLVTAATTAQDGQRFALVNQADQEAWSDYVDLPIVALPQAVVCQPGVTGVAPNAAPDGPAYDATSWGLAPGTP